MVSTGIETRRLVLDGDADGSLRGREGQRENRDEREEADG
jgi:hypothetical protein